MSIRKRCLSTYKVPVICISLNIFVILAFFFISARNNFYLRPEGQQICQHSPANIIDKASKDNIYQAQREWRLSVLKTVERLINTRAKKWERFEIFQSIPEACPLPLQRVGLGSGEGKMLCALEHVLKLSPVVISLGSAGDYSFEEALVSAQHAALVHTFDCTGDFEYGGKFSRRITFHKKCLGVKNEISQKGEQFITYNKMLEQLGNPYIGLLKIDIEGYEFEIMPAILEMRDKYLPVLITVEVHYQTGIADLSWSYKSKENTRGPFGSGGKSAAELALLSMLFMQKGYVLISKENNCGTCTELVFLKTYCESH